MYIYQPFRQELECAIREHSGFIEGKVLDVGGGAYQRYRSLFKCESYTTVDLDGADVKGDARALPFPAASFDSIVCTQTIGDIFELDLVFSEFARVLKPGGVLLVTECAFSPLGTTADYWRFTPQSLTKLAENASLKPIKIFQIGSYHSLLARIKLRKLLAWFNPQSRWQMALYNRLSKWVSQRAWKDDAKNWDKTHANGYLLLAER